MMIVFFGFLFLMSIQPMMMIALLIMISLFYTFFIYKIMMGYWFSYALIMVMLSGVLVVFTYMISLVPNEKFEIYSLVFIIFFMFIYIDMGYYLYMEDMSFICLFLWNSYMSGFNMLLVIFLLMMMVMVVWMSCLGEGAVRVDY